MMGKKKLVFILLFFVSGWAFSQGTPLKVMTFNIRYNNPADSIFNWDHRKGMVFEVIRKYSPDIAGFQEVLYDQLLEMKDSLKGYSWFGVGRDDGAREGEFAVICFRNNRFMQVDGSEFWLSKTPDVPGSKSWKSACTRIVTWVMLRDMESGHLFFVFNTHFDHASEEARVESAKLLKRKMDEITSGRPTVITGDFNSKSSEKAYQILTEKTVPSPLIDSRESLSDSARQTSYSFVGFPFHPEEGNLVDFIFTRNAPLWKVRSSTIITDNINGRYPSDHLPVMTEFSLLRPSK